MSDKPISFFDAPYPVSYGKAFTMPPWEIAKLIPRPKTPLPPYIRKFVPPKLPPPPTSDETLKDVCAKAKCVKRPSTPISKVKTVEPEFIPRALTPDSPLCCKANAPMSRLLMGQSIVFDPEW